MIAILFDLDGTLVDSSIGILDSLRHMLAAMEAPDRPDAELRSWIGPPLQVCARQLAGCESEQQVDRAVHAYRARYREHGVHLSTPFPGIVELLGELAGRGDVRMGVATSKPTDFARQIVEQHELHRWLPVLHGADWEGQLTKADLIAAALGELSCDEAVMIGDRRFDIEGAHQHDISAVGVTYGFGTRDELEQAGADVVCDDVPGLALALRNFLGA
ncbi:MAG: HAD hydrolase-like protein [Planctomycetales bacterium]|nr:HAD hydrolase-like protein [Planctomycetales bacterium]